MSNKIVAALLATIAVVPAGLFGQGSAGFSGTTTPLVVSANFSAVSQYMFRGQRRGGPAWQPSVEIGSGGFTSGLWANLPFQGKVPYSSVPELDLYGSYVFKVASNVSVVPGFTFFDYPRAPTNRGYFRSTVEPCLAVNYSVRGVKLTPTYYHDLELRESTYELTSTYAFPLQEIGTELDFTGQVGTYLQRNATRELNPPAKAWGNYWLLGVAAPFQITRESKITVGFAYTEGRGARYKRGSLPAVPHGMAAERGVVTLGYSHTF
jgi:hypothetical protein